jgi:hypothetical protein
MASKLHTQPGGVGGGDRFRASGGSVQTVGRAPAENFGGERGRMFETCSVAFKLTDRTMSRLGTRILADEEGCEGGGGGLGVDGDVAAPHVDNAGDNLWR